MMIRCPSPAFAGDPSGSLPPMLSRILTTNSQLKTKRMPG